jgi:NAD(P)H-dependent flavin oxidoreductase YrpB (nitropropane dioxygenase family)
MILFPKHRKGQAYMTSRLHNALCERLGIDVPVMQAPRGSAAAPELAAAVAEAGGLGMLASTWQSPQRARLGIRHVRQRTSRPFGVNLVLDFPVIDTLAVCLDEAVPVISTFWVIQNPPATGFVTPVRCICTPSAA